MEANSSPVQMDPRSGVQSAPTAGETVIPNYPKELYDDAHIENGHRDFNAKLMEARGPNRGKPEYVTPPVPPAIVEATRLEMEAGKARVSHFEKIEVERKAIAARTPEKWEKTAEKTVAVFRPPDFDEYKTTLKSPAQTVSKDQGLRQPRR